MPGTGNSEGYRDTCQPVSHDIAVRQVGLIRKCEDTLLVLDVGGQQEKRWKKAIRFGTGKKTVIMKDSNPKLPQTKEYQPAIQ